MLLRGFLGGEPDVQSSRDNGTSIEVAAGARGALPAGSRRRRPRRRVHAAECSRSSRSEFDSGLRVLYLGQKAYHLGSTTGVLCSPRPQVLLSTFSSLQHNVLARGVNTKDKANRVVGQDG